MTPLGEQEAQLIQLQSVNSLFLPSLSSFSLQYVPVSLSHSNPVFSDSKHFYLVYSVLKTSASGD